VRPAARTLALEDPLDYLPRKRFRNWAKDEVIYDSQYSAVSLYLVVKGRVKTYRTLDDGSQIIGRIIGTEGLFGESALIGSPDCLEKARTLDAVAIMEWTRSELESQMDREPRLAIALGQYMVRQCIALKDRLEAMALYKTPERVMLALFQLASSLGTPTETGLTRIAWMPHQTIADYVGTSREIVSTEMNRLRRQGLLQYSRKHIDIYLEVLRGKLCERVSRSIMEG